MAKEVKILKNFRDDVLLKNAVGKALVKAYYRFSPPVTNFVAKHDSLRILVRWCLLPIIGVSWVSDKFEFVSKLFIIILLLSLVIAIFALCYRKAYFHKP